MLKKAENKCRCQLKLASVGYTRQSTSAKILDSTNVVTNQMRFSKNSDLLSYEFFKMSVEHYDVCEYDVTVEFIFIVIPTEVQYTLIG